MQQSNELFSMYSSNNMNIQAKDVLTLQGNYIRTRSNGGGSFLEMKDINLDDSQVKGYDKTVLFVSP
jgi:hypothetical protein